MSNDLPLALVPSALPVAPPTRKIAEWELPPPEDLVKFIADYISTRHSTWVFDSDEIWENVEQYFPAVTPYQFNVALMHPQINNARQCRRGLKIANCQDMLVDAMEGALTTLIERHQDPEESGYVRTTAAATLLKQGNIQIVNSTERNQPATVVINNNNWRERLTETKAPVFFNCDFEEVR
jgi:hypothetical protein